MRRSRVLKIRLTDEEHALWHSYAEEHGTSIADFVRAAANDVVWAEHNRSLDGTRFAAPIELALSGSVPPPPRPLSGSSSVPPAQDSSSSWKPYVPKDKA